MGLVGEIFDSLIIDQGIDRARVGLLIALVHLAAKLQTPFGDPIGIDDIAADRDEGDPRDLDSVEDPKNGYGEGQFDEGRQDREECVAQQRIDGLGAALDHAAEATGLAVEMELQRQAVQVLEGPERDLPDRPLTDLREEEVSQLLKREAEDPGGAVGQDDEDRDRDLGGRAACVAGQRQGVHGFLVQQRNYDDRALGREEAQHREHDASPQIRPVRRPEVRQQILQGLPMAARTRRGGRNGIGRHRQGLRRVFRAGSPGFPAAYRAWLAESGLLGPDCWVRITGSGLLGPAYWVRPSERDSRR